MSMVFASNPLKEGNEIPVKIIKLRRETGVSHTRLKRRKGCSLTNGYGVNHFLWVFLLSGAFWKLVLECDSPSVAPLLKLWTPLLGA